MATYMGRYHEDEVEHCCICQDTGEPWYENDLPLINYDGDWYCEDCLFNKLYTFERAVNYILHWEPLEEEFDFQFYPGYFREVLKFEEENSDIEQYIAENIEDFADWFSENKKHITPLQEIKKGNQNEQVISNSKRA